MNDPRTRFSREIQGEIDKHFPNLTFQTTIRNNVRLREAASFGQPITQYDPRSIGFEDYAALAQEVLTVEEHLLETAMLNDAHETFTHPVGKQGEFLIAINEPDAEDVRIAGDFNEWIPDRKVFSIKEEDGLWRKILRLSPGRYQYRLIVDGQWREDPANPQVVENYHGGYNSLLTIE
jgi:hypothetical protein